MLRKLGHPYILLSLAVLFWSGNSVIGRTYAGEIPPFAMVFWRWVIAVILLTPLCLKPFLRDIPLLRKHFVYVACQGVLSISCFNAFLYWGLHYTTVVNTSLIQASMPIVTLFFSLLLLRKGISLWGGLGIGLSLLGVAWVVVQGNPASFGTLALNPGDLLILGAVTVWSVYSVLLSKKPLEINRFSFTWAMMLCGITFLLPFYLWEVSSGATFELNLHTLPAFAYIGIFPSVLSFLFWMRGVELVGANSAGIFLNLMPIFGALLGMVLLGESLQTFHYMGIAMIIPGIWLVTAKK